MNNVKMMGSLLDRLLSYVSSAPERDANYDIAVALLRNYSQLKGLALSQIADLCYTSNASISRFCRFLGMDNFKEFQSWMERDFTMRTDYSRQFYTMLHNNQETAISAYRDALIGNIYTTIAPENAQVIPDICNAILSSGCKMLIITQNLASPYLNTADFILQCGTTNRNDVGKYAALMANDLILMGYLRAYDKAFQ